MMKQGFWSRPRGPLLLGLAACAACCTAPLAAIVIGAGAASTLAAIAEPIAGVLLGGAAILAITIFVRRRRAAAAAACATDGSCGCGPAPKRTLFSSPEPIADAPVACTIDLSNREMVQKGLMAYRGAFEHLVLKQRTASGFRWTFRHSPGLEPVLRQLAEGEAGCCSFMKFDLTVTPSEIIWDVRAEPHAQAMIDEYFRMPELLKEEPRSGHDLEHIKRTTEKVGLVFTADQPR